MKIAGCVPAFNNQSTIAQAVASLRAQTIPLDDIFVVDDGSTDATALRAQEAGARVVSLGSNQGRGAARARAILETDADLLVSVDGTNALAPDFLEKCLPWSEDPKVAAVYGRLTQSSTRTAADRWRGRHLFRQDQLDGGGRVHDLITWGLVQRVVDFRAVGNYDQTCRHSEDAEMGDRLTASGYGIVYEPEAALYTLTSNSVREVFERYWRWNQAAESQVNLKRWIRFWWYSLKVLTLRDLRSGDLACVFFSSLLPYYCFIRSVNARQKQRR